MIKSISIILIFGFVLSAAAQKRVVEALIDQVAQDIVPPEFDYYFFKPKSIQQERSPDSLQNYQIREFKMEDENFPEDFWYVRQTDTVDWTQYNLKNARYVEGNAVKYAYTSPPHHWSVRFVKYNIDQKKYDSLMANKPPQTLYVKKKWFWNKKNIRSNKKFKTALNSAWALDEKLNPEEKIYYSFSEPVFSEDKRYAWVVILKLKRCGGLHDLVLYRKDETTWKRIYQTPLSQIIAGFVHGGSCEDLRYIEIE